MNIEYARDWAVIVLAALALVQSLLVIVLVAVLVNVSLTLKRGVIPILDSVRHTVDNVRGTSTFVSNTVVKPVVRATSFIMGVQKGITVLGRIFRRKGGRPK